MNPTTLINILLLIGGILRALRLVPEEQTIAKPEPPADNYDVVIDSLCELYAAPDLPEAVVAAPILRDQDLWLQAARTGINQGHRIPDDQIGWLMEAWQQWGSGDERHLAYIIASIWHECKFVPKDERRANPARQPKLYRQQAQYWYHPAGDGRPGFFGRGPIQLTWERNYKRFGKLLGIPLHAHPEIANDPQYGYQIAVLGMVQGLFTGAPLRWYIDNHDSDYVNARRTVNGDVKLNGARIAADAEAVLARFIQLKNSQA